MKSYSKFIIEGKKGTAVASPSPGGDPLDPKGRRKIEKKFSNPSNPPKVANPEAPKPKPEGVRQADVSKQAAKYRRAQRVKGATGGKPTGSLSKGNLSFPGDRSGATARVKADLEARKGFSGSRSGGLKADEANPNVNRAVRQQRTVTQSVPDPFKSKTPAPARPFKGISKKTKSGSPVDSLPDPFKSATSDPKKVKPKLKTPSGPGPAMSQALKDIRSAMSRRGIKTTESDVVQRYMRKAQDTGRRIDPDLVGAQGVKASGAKPEMVGTRAPSGAGARFRAQADAAKDISKQRGADLDKAIKNLTTTGNVKGAGGTPFKGYTYPGGTLNPTTGRGSGGSVNPSTNKPEFKNTGRSGYAPELKPKPGSEPVVYKPKKDPLEPFYRTTGGSSQPKVVNPSTNKPEFKNTGSFGYRPEYKPKSGSTPVPSKPGDITLAGPSEGKPRFPASKGSELAKNKSFRQFSVDSGGALSKGRTGGLSKLDDIIDVEVKDLGPTKPSKLSGSAGTFKQLRSGSQTLKPASGTLKGLKGFAKGAGRVGGPLLAVAGAGLDYADDRAKGYSRTSSVLRTGAKHLGGAALGALGSVAGPLGTAAGYAAGHWLTSKVLDKFNKPKKPKKVAQTPKQRFASKVKNTVGAPVRSLTGAPPPKPSVKPVKTDPKEYLKVNR